MAIFSSGDLLADRRYAYAEDAAAARDPAAAADLFAQVIERVPDWAPAWLGLGCAKIDIFQNDNDESARRDAIEALTRALALDPADRFGAGLHLARIGAGSSTIVMSPAYVAALFDEYAPRFDRHLTEALAYRAPDLLADAIERSYAAIGRAFPVARLLDLGCGTGLAAALFRDRATHMAGVDLSENMVAEARRKGLYDRLTVGEAAAALAGEEAATIDLILAADVFVYVGDLAPILAEAARALAPGGFMAFTVQSHEGDGFLLGDDLRYAHSAHYLRTMIAQNDLSLVLLEPASSRRDRGLDVPGLVAVARKS